MTTPASALIADIGATNARFALLDGTELAVSETYAVSDYASPIEAARHFLAGPAAGHAPKHALIAAAGPVEHGRIALTNAAWIVDSDRISKGLGMTDVQVLNDFSLLGRVHELEVADEGPVNAPVPGLWSGMRLLLLDLLGDAGVCCQLFHLGSPLCDIRAGAALTASAHDAAILRLGSIPISPARFWPKIFRRSSSVRAG